VKLKNTEQTNIEGSLTLLGSFYLATFFITPKIRKQRVMKIASITEAQLIFFKKKVTFG